MSQDDKKAAASTRRTIALPPLCGDPDRLIEIVRLREQHGIEAWPDIPKAQRRRFEGTLRALGLVEEDGSLAMAAHALLGAANRQEAFAAALQASQVGRSWTYHAAVDDVADLPRESADDFLAAFTTMKERDRAESAATLEQWVRWCRHPFPGLPRTAGNARPTAPPAPNPPADGRTRRWPPATTFPHNESGQTVRAIVQEDLARGPILVVVGYAALAELIPFLSKQHAAVRPLRLLFGNEPFRKTRDSWALASSTLSEEVRQYWLEWGISVLRSAEVLQARDVVARQATEVRVATRQRPLHAKIYVSDTAVTIGSSNFTENGLADQSEGNARFLASDGRYQEARLLAEGFWEAGVDYKEGLLNLLDALLKEVDWREALGRACAEVLEGRWAEKYLPPAELGGLERPLWPHQREGISQAIWTLQNTGSVLIADATGSGKTRMGAWLLRAVYDWRVRQGHGPRPRHVVITPQAVTIKWRGDLQEAGLGWHVYSGGVLSSRTSRDYEALISAVEACELLAVDEAHNYLNQLSQRTQRLLRNSSDHAVLFTATPISRRASDLLGLVDLLGADHFSPEAQERLEQLHEVRSGEDADLEADRDVLRREIQSFMVRRTRDQLNEFSDAAPDAYRLGNGRVARYPKVRAAQYAMPLDAHDAELATRIAELADQLLGIGRVGEVIALTSLQRETGMTDETYVRRITAAAAALARHDVLDSLRSSRAALVEHVLGTATACLQVAGLTAAGKRPLLGAVAALDAIADQLPRWELSEEARAAAPGWLIDADARRQACEDERQRYREIARLAAELSDAREQRKTALLEELCREHVKVIAFDSHTLSLFVFEQMLEARGVRTLLVTGSDAAEGKRKAERNLGHLADDEPIVALFSDALSESLNLQKPAALVHLDYPTVIRQAEQRVGRIDRMDSPNDEIYVWYPDESGGFTPRRRDRLRERHEVVSSLIGSNLLLPDDAPNEPLRPDLSEVAAGEADELFDAFRSVRGLVVKGGLVGPEIYRRMRDSQENIASCAGIVESARYWGFFAVGNETREAPRWVFLDDGGDVETDLATISHLLEQRLGSSPQRLPLKAAAGHAIDRLLTQLIRQERRLLPRRRQRLLELAARVLRTWFLEAEEAGDDERVEVLRQCRRLLVPWQDRNAVPHLRAVADRWSELLRPFKQQALELRVKRKRWGLDALEPALLAQPPSTNTLRETLMAVPMVPSLDNRIVAMVIGMPQERTPS